MSANSGAAPSADSEFRPDRPTRYDLTLALAVWPPPGSPTAQYEPDFQIHVRHPTLMNTAVCGLVLLRYHDGGSRSLAPTPDEPDAKATCQPCNHWLMRLGLRATLLCGLIPDGAEYLGAAVFEDR